MKITLTNSKLYKLDQSFLYTVYTEKLFLVNMANGNYDGVEQIMTIKFDRENSIMQKVGAKFELGKIYLHYGEIDQAKNAFEFVLNNGYNLHRVQEARMYLQQLMNGADQYD